MDKTIVAVPSSFLMFTGSFWVGIATVNAADSIAEATQQDMLTLAFVFGFGLVSIVVLIGMEIIRRMM